MAKYFVLMIVVGLLGGCSNTDAWMALVDLIESGTAAEVADINNQTAPDFFFTDYDGENYTLSDFDDKIIVLNFWASWCAPCRSEISTFREFHQQYSSDVVFIGLSYADYEPAALEFIDTNEITYLVGPDTGETIADEYGVAGIPETFIIDRNGDIAYHFVSIIDEATLEDILNKLLSQ